MVLHGISNQKYEEAMGAEGLIVVVSECTRIDTTYLFIAMTLCALFYSDFKIGCGLFRHAGFKQSQCHFNPFFACIIYVYYVGKVISLLCAGYRNARSSLSWVGWGCCVWGEGARGVMWWEQQTIRHLHTD